MVYVSYETVWGLCDTFVVTCPVLSIHTSTHVRRTSSLQIWIPYPGSRTLATQPGTSFPLKPVDEHSHTLMHYERMSMRCKWQGYIVRWAPSGSAMWHSWMGCRGLAGGKDGSSHNGPLKGCRRGTRLALVLLPFQDSRRRLLLGTNSMQGLL